MEGRLYSITIKDVGGWERSPWGIFAITIFNIMKKLIKDAKSILARAAPWMILSGEFTRELETNNLKEIIAAIKIVRGVLEKQYNLGRKDARTDMTGPKRIAPLTKLDKAALKHLESYNFHLIKNLNDDLRDAIRRELVNGVREGIHPQELRKRLEKLPLEPLPAGRRVISPAERAEMIARTEWQRAYNLGRYREMVDAGIREFCIVVGGGRVRYGRRRGKPRTCQRCRDIASQKYTQEDLESVGLPPFHPRCRCVLVSCDVTSKNG